MNSFFKRKVYLRHVSICFAAVLLLLTNTAVVFAIGYTFGDIDVNFDTTLTVGASFRVEDRDWDLVGMGNQPNYANTKDALTLKDLDYLGLYGGGTVPQGAWSHNGDDGNLNFDKGVFSEIVKLTSEFKLSYKDFGLFSRASFFYDIYLMNESDDMRVDIFDNHSTKRQHGTNLDLLDAFIYYNSYIKEIPFSVRIGQQVINWGESSYIPHGISETNPINVTKLRAPGAELKEAYIPVGSIWTSVGVSETINFEAFYQYKFERMIVDGAGTYFSTNDFISDGSNYIQSGFQYPDLTTPTPYGGMNPDLGLLGNHVVMRLDDKDASNEGQFGLKCSWFAEKLNGTEFGFYFANYHSRRPLISGYIHDGIPIDTFLNLAMKKIEPNLQLNGLDPNVFSKEYKMMKFGMNLPDSFIANFPTQTSKQRFIIDNYAKSSYIPGDIFDGTSDFADHIRDGLIHGYVEYPENIKLYGLSFNTVLPNGMSVAGEYSYREDQPLQIDDVELIMALSSPLYDVLMGSNYALPNGKLIDLSYYSQHPHGKGLLGDGTKTNPGDLIVGYQRFNVSQAQVTFTQLFSEFFGADKTTALAELAYVYIHDLPDQDVLRFDVSGTARSKNPIHEGIGNFSSELGKYWYNNAIITKNDLMTIFPTNPSILSTANPIYSPEGLETNEFATKFSWGYVLMVNASYLNVFRGINVSPKLTFSHDVYGYTPMPISTFIRHRKSLSLNINLDYQNRWSVDFGGRLYWGGGTQNTLSDRDYVWINFKYSI